MRESRRSLDHLRPVSSPREAAEPAVSAKQPFESLRIRADFDPQDGGSDPFVTSAEARSIASGPMTPQMATISECRYRWLRLRDLNLLICADRG